MNALKKIAVLRTLYIIVMFVLAACAAAASALLHMDSGYTPELDRLEAGIPSPTAGLASSIEEPDFSYERCVVTFTGSINVGSMLGSASYGTFNGLYNEKGGAYFLEDVSDITKKDDITFAFLSSVFSDSEELETRDKSEETEIGWYKAPAANADILSLGGIDAISLECPGTEDYGTDGYNDTKAALESCFVEWGDSGKAIYRSYSSGISIAVYPCSYEEENVPGIIEWIQKASALHDFVAVMISSDENSPTDMETDFRSFIDAGAELVVCTNCRNIAAAESYGEGFIAYSLGSLIDGSDKYGEKYSVILETEIIINDGEIGRINYSTVSVENYSEDSYWRPTVADAEE